ncbi:unnamed protein product [Mytilus coruscus]|uniref:Uncharacterized protein n=1 Tax=Mytilus coruscus TaxID=42192 RepID=A0A6J8F543_MYTCO|nr:unnamed protein product [Mytilus coruscus]
MSKLSTELDSASNLCSERQDEIDTCKNTVANLECQLEQFVCKAEVQNKEILENSGELKSLQNQFTALNEEKDSLMNLKDQLENDLSVCRNKLSQQDELLGEKTSEIEKLKNLVGMIEKSKEDLETDIARQNEQSGMQEKSYNEMIHELNLKVDSLQGQLQNFKSEMLETESQIKELNREKDDLEIALSYKLETIQNRLKKTENEKWELQQELNISKTKGGRTWSRNNQ